MGVADLPGGNFRLSGRAGRSETSGRRLDLFGVCSARAVIMNGAEQREGRLAEVTPNPGQAAADSSLTDESPNPGNPIGCRATLWWYGPAVNGNTTGGERSSCQPRRLRMCDLDDGDGGAVVPDVHRSAWATWRRCMRFITRRRTSGRRSLTIVTNVAAPYRDAVFLELERRLHSEVYLLAADEPNRGLGDRTIPTAQFGRRRSPYMAVDDRGTSRCRPGFWWSDYIMVGGFGAPAMVTSLLRPRSTLIWSEGLRDRVGTKRG